MNLLKLLTILLFNLVYNISAKNETNKYNPEIECKCSVNGNLKLKDVPQKFECVVKDFVPNVKGVLDMTLYFQPASISDYLVVNIYKNYYGSIVQCYSFYGSDLEFSYNKTIDLEIEIHEANINYFVEILGQASEDSVIKIKHIRFMTGKQTEDILKNNFTITCGRKKDNKSDHHTKINNLRNKNAKINREELDFEEGVTTNIAMTEPVTETEIITSETVTITADDTTDTVIIATDTASISTDVTMTENITVATEDTITETEAIIDGITAETVIITTDDTTTDPPITTESVIITTDDITTEIVNDTTDDITTETVTITTDYTTETMAITTDDMTTETATITTEYEAITTDSATILTDILTTEPVTITTDDTTAEPETEMTAPLPKEGDDDFNILSIPVFIAVMVLVSVISITVVVLCVIYHLLPTRIIVPSNDDNNTPRLVNLSSITRVEDDGRGNSSSSNNFRNGDSSPV